jgi:hypothetical protein
MLWIGLGTVIAAVMLIVAILVLVVQRWSPHSDRVEHNDVAGSVFQVLGGLYGVLLAFVVVNEWQAVQSASQNTFTEANELGALYWNARAMPATAGRDLEATAKQYAHMVIDSEWPAMANGGYSVDATDLVYKMRDEINALPTDTPREQTLFGQSLTHVNSLESARRQRLSETGNQVPLILWIGLVLGAVVTTAYTFLFGLSRSWSHLLIVGPSAVLVVLALVLIAMLDQPFSGAVAIAPDAFHIFLRGLPPQR